MAELTHKHLETITADVRKADISFSHLPYDLIDHICCDLEYQMSQGLPFEKAYDTVKAKIGLRGLQQIQEDTLLLIDKKYRIMKNTMKIFGVVAPILMAIGSLFKIEHWPGAGILITLGFFLLCFVFLPSAVYVSYREVSNRKKLFTHLTGFLAAFLFAISFLFKIQHWPFTGKLMLIATIITGLFFLPAFFINQLKTSPKNQKIIYIFGLIGSLAYLAGFFFKINHWPGAAILTLSGALFLIFIAFPLFIVSHYKNHEHVSSRFIFLTFAVIWFVLPTSLIALNVSGDVLKGLKSDGIAKEQHIQYLTSKNNTLAKDIETRLEAEPAKTKEVSSHIKKSSDELVAYIQSLKIRIIGLTKGENANPNQPIHFDAIDVTNKDGGQQVLFQAGEATRLKEKLEAFRQTALQHVNNDSISAVLIAQLLATAPPPKNAPEHFKSWESYNLKAYSLITTINKLSGFQENARTSEYIVLKSISQKQAFNQSFATTK